MWGLLWLDVAVQDDEHGGVVQYDVPAGIQFNGALGIFPYPAHIVKSFWCHLQYAIYRGSRRIAEGGLGEGADVSTIAFTVGT